MPDQVRNLMIGLFITAAIVAGVWVLFFINPSVGDAGQLLRVRFTNIDKVHLGTHVTFAGKHVGEVVNIRPVPRSDSCSVPVTDTGLVSVGQCSPPVYVYELTLQLDSGVSIYRSDRIMVVTSGILGEKSVAIFPQCCASDEPQERLSYDDIVIAEPSSGGVEEALGGFSSLADRADQTLREISDLLGKISNLWPEVESSVQDLAASMANAREITADGKVLVATTRHMVEQVEQGEGSLGRLVSDPRLYLQVSSIVSKAEVLMDDINHYGLLFHLDRSWKRQRTLKMNRLQELDTADKFRTYVQKEMAEMDTSLSRLVLAMEAQDEDPQELIEDRKFADAFKELSRRIESLKERLDDYNSMIHKPEPMACE